MKKFLKYIIELFITLKISIIKIKAKILGDYVINRYIENCSERFIAFSLNKFGAHVAMNANIRMGLKLDNTYNKYCKIHIGDNCFVGKGAFFDLADEVILEKEAMVGANVMIITHQDSGNRGDISKFYERRQKRVLVKEGAFVGHNSTILCGITIGKCALVGAGSVVTKDVDDYCVVAGVPARVIKRLKN